MKEPDPEKKEQMQERIRNALTVINTYRAQHLEDIRLEHIQTQLEEVEAHLEENAPFTYQEKQQFNFNLTEDTPLERNGPLNRELYSIRNFIDTAL